MQQRPSPREGSRPSRQARVDYIIRLMPDDLAEPMIGVALIKDQVRRLPNAPGVYRMLGEEGEVLYVGKARSLKNRVGQYAQGRAPAGGSST